MKSLVESLLDGEKTLTSRAEKSSRKSWMMKIIVPILNSNEPNEKTLEEFIDGMNNTGSLLGIESVYGISNKELKASNNNCYIFYREEGLRKRQDIEITIYRQTNGKWEYRKLMWTNGDVYISFPMGSQMNLIRDMIYLSDHSTYVWSLPSEHMEQVWDYIEKNQDNYTVI